MKVLLLCLIVGIFGITGGDGLSSPFERALERDFNKFFETGHLGKIVKNVVKELNVGEHFLKSFGKHKWSKAKVNLFCSTCVTGVNQILKLEDPRIIVERTILLCIELGLGNELVCDGLIRSNEDDLIYILDNTPGETGNDICGMIFMAQGCTTKNPDRIWEIPLPDTTKPPVDETPYPPPGKPTMKVLHLADTHYDPAYTPGASVDCEEIYLCCRIQSMPKNSNDEAGFWGNYGNCDIPRWTLERIFEHASSAHPDIDFIVWTGDIIPHSVWENSREGNLLLIRDTADLVSKYFPGIPVFPAVGNHEGAPVNQFPQPYITEPDFDISWLYDSLKDVWGRWLPEEAAKSVAYGAYYTVQIMPGLRVLSVNTNYCYGLNWWLVYDSKDIAEELSLVVQELQKAEDNGDQVYIIGHIPLGSADCYFTWSHQFNKILSRYENTISGLFYAHTHKDQFEVLFNQEDPDRAYQVAYVAPSQTTYSDLNPGYRLYTIEGQYEGSRFRVLDHETWIMDLDIANSKNETDFFKLYSAKEAYGLKDLSGDSWFNLVKEMNKPNSTMFDKYYRNFVKAGTPRLVEGCNEECKSSLLCDALISDTSDNSKCQEIIYNKK